MAYSQNTIIDVNAPNVLQGILETLLLAEGWTVVEALTPSTTFKTTVYRSAAANNQAGYDWYLAIMWNSVGTEQQMEILAGSGYDTGTHTLSGIAGSLAGTGSSPAYSDAAGMHYGSRNVNVATNVATTFQSHGSTYTKPWFACIVPSSAFAYWASVTPDHVALFTTIAVPASGSPWIMVGTLDVSPTWSTHGFPVVSNPVINFALSPAISGTVPGTGTTVSDYRLPTADYTRPIGSRLPALSNFYQPAWAWKPDFYLASLVGAGVAGGWTSLVGFGDGFLIGSAVDWYCVFGGSVGDTVEIEGSTYVLSGPSVFGVNNNLSDERVTVAVLAEGV